jgi:hypothetical protein
MSWQRAQELAADRLPILLRQAVSMREQFGETRAVTLIVYPDVTSYRLAHPDSPWPLNLHTMVQRALQRAMRKHGYQVTLKLAEPKGN